MPVLVNERRQRAIDLIRGFITVAEAQSRGAALAIPVLSLELAVLELSADQHSYKED
jgi:phosphosulfolactate phosphohydrolase-like enzyme